MEEMSLLHHLVLDLLLCGLIGFFPSLAVWNRKRRRGFVSAFIAVLGVAFFVVGVSHINLFDTMVRLSEYDWVHKLATGVIFGAVSLPVAWLASRKKVKAGWILVIGVMVWVSLGAQWLALRFYRPSLDDEVVVWRSLRSIENSIKLHDPGGLARNIKIMPAPADPHLYDLVLSPVLRGALFSRHPAVSQAAAEKISERGDPKLLPELLDAMTGAAPGPRRAMERAADKLAGKPAAAKVLVQAMLENKGPCRQRAVMLLAKKHPDTLEKVVPNLLRYGDEELRILIVELVRSGTTGMDMSRIVDGLILALSSDDPDESAGAVQSLAAIGDMPEVRSRLRAEPLIKLLWSGEANCRPAAAQLLKVIGQAKAVPALLDAAKSEDPATAREAIAALVALRAKDATGIFIEALSSADTQTRTLGYEGLKQVLARNTPADSPTVVKILVASRREEHS